MNVVIAEAASDERGALAHGKKGDQTGNEVRFRTINGTETGSGAFTKILHYPDSALRRCFAKDAMQIVDNNFIGYAQYGPDGDQYAGRYGLYWAMQSVNSFSQIAVACNVDCSAMVADILIHNGIRCPYTMRTATEITVLTQLDFEELDFKIEECRVGDILWRQGHTAMVVEAPESEEDFMYSAVLKSSKDMKMWSTGAGILTRETPYVTVKRSNIGFKPNVIVVQQVGEILSNTQWMRGQSHAYCANYENNAYAGVAVGKAKGFFNPDANEIIIPVRFAEKDYMVKIY